MTDQEPEDKQKKKRRTIEDSKAKSHAVAVGRKSRLSLRRENKRESFQKIFKVFRSMKMTVDRNYFLKKPNVNLNVGYAIIRFLESQLESGKIAFKTADNDPNTFANAVFIEEKKQISIHFRAPLRDRWHNIADHVDVDIYLPLSEIEKICKLKANFS